MQIIRPKKRKGSFFLLFAAVLVIAAAASVLFVTALQDGELVVAAKLASSQTESEGEPEPSRLASSALESSAPASSALASPMMLQINAAMITTNATRTTASIAQPEAAWSFFSALM